MCRLANAGSVSATPMMLTTVSSCANVDLEKKAWCAGVNVPNGGGFAGSSDAGSVRLMGWTRGVVASVNRQNLCRKG